MGLLSMCLREQFMSLPAGLYVFVPESTYLKRRAALSRSGGVKWTGVTAFAPFVTRVGLCGAR
jgi:hypothetical protein